MVAFALGLGYRPLVIINARAAPDITADLIAPPNLIGGFSEANSWHIL